MGKQIVRRIIYGKLDELRETGATLRSYPKTSVDALYVEQLVAKCEEMETVSQEAVFNIVNTLLEEEPGDGHTDDD